MSDTVADNYLKIVIPDFDSDRVKCRVSEIFLFRSRDTESIAMAKAKVEARKTDMGEVGRLARVSVYRRVPGMSDIPIIGEIRTDD